MARKQTDRGYGHGIYVIGEWVGTEDDGLTPIMSPYVKVGLAANPTSRLVNLQTANPRPLLLLHWRPYATRAKAAMAEWRAHREMAAAKRVGEWFETDADTAAHVIEYVS